MSIKDQCIEIADRERREAIEQSLCDAKRADENAASYSRIKTAALKMWEVLLSECQEKHQLDPRESAINGDYHLELTVSVRELRQFAASIRPED